MRWIRCAVGIVAAIGCLYVATALALVFWPAAIFNGARQPTRAEIAAGERWAGIVREQVYPFTPRRFLMRDGTALFARQFGTRGGPTILFLHGVNSDSSAMNVPAGLLRQSTGARIVALDLRGHGQSGGKPWQVDYAGQYEDDVADVVSALRKEQPHGRIILAGHSMGGGIALSYALNRAAPPVDGYFLAAPLLGPDAPTARAAPAPGEASRTAAKFMYFRTPRLIGAIMLNLIGVRAVNSLPILYLNQPGAAAYGFAALQSMQPSPPEDYCVALRTISVPLLVIAGTRDEAFEAARYPDVVRRCSRGEAVLVDGASHSGVLTDPHTVAALTSWARASHLLSSSI